MSVVKIYKNTADARKLDKRAKLALLETYNNVHWKKDTDVSNPVIELTAKALDANIATTNYCYIADFGRYYFIDKLELTQANVLRLHCRVDVLMSFKTQIEALNAYIERQEKEFDKDLNDALMPVSERTNYKVYSFGNVPSAYNYYVTTTGGVN